MERATVTPETLEKAVNGQGNTRSTSPSEVSATPNGQKQAKEAAKRLWVSSGIPERHGGRKGLFAGVWDDTRQKLEKTLHSGAIVVVLGPRGTGKTQLGVETIRSACKRLIPARYTKAIDVFMAARAGSFSPEKMERDLLKGFLAPHLLVIDAMEERAETDFEGRMLAYLIDKRYDGMKDTVMISNQTREAFAESIGPSIVSRIHETGEVFECAWPSFRERKK